MIKLLSYFGNGLLYIILIPYYLIKYALSFVHALIVFIGGEIISLFHFLNGKKYRNVDQLSLQLETLLRQEALQKQTMTVPSINPQEMNMNNNQYNYQNQPHNPYNNYQNFNQNNSNQFPNYPNYPNQPNQNQKDKDRL